MRTSFELQKLSEWWFDLSKIAIGSMVVKLFEPGGARFGWESVVALVFGLTLALYCASMGTKFARRVI